MGWLGAVGMHGLNCKQPFRCAAMCEFIPATIVGNSATTACDDLVLHHVHMSVLIMSILWCSITPTPLGKAWSCNLDPGAACFDLGLSARAWGCVLGLGAGPGASAREPPGIGCQGPCGSMRNNQKMKTEGVGLRREPSAIGASVLAVRMQACICAACAHAGVMHATNIKAQAQRDSDEQSKHKPFSSAIEASVLPVRMQA
eukprot:1156304-Pelagomonas_calceolata.AAC.2